MTNFNGMLETIYPTLTSQDIADYNAAYPPSDFPSETFHVWTVTGEAIFHFAVSYFPKLTLRQPLI